jgi:hypothetical protein
VQNNFPMRRIKFLPRAQHSNQIHTKFALDTSGYGPYSARNLVVAKLAFIGHSPN